MSFQENKEENTQNNQAESNAQEQESNELPVPPQSDEEKIAALEAELASVNEKLVETHNRMLRIAADAENTRKRLEKEKADTRVYCIQEFARDLLPVIDSFEKALQTLEQESESSEQTTKLVSMTEGIKLISKIFQDVTKKHGIERIPGKGSPFNPMLHNAISKVADSSYQTETVIEEFMPGYKIADRVLRTALVKVGAPD